MAYDFDTVVPRRGTASIKWDVSAPFGAHQGLTPFWIADMDFATPPEVVQAMQRRCAHPVFGYSIPQPGCIEAVCAWYKRRHGFGFAPEEVLPGVGVVTMLRVAIEAFTAPGDSVLVFSPVYDPFFKVIAAAGRTVADVPLMRDENGRYGMDIAAAEVALAAGAKAVLFCNPHNPVGRVWTREELARLAALCARHRALILSDEVHGDITYAGHPYTPVAALPEAEGLSLVFTAISKTFNLAGLGASCTIVKNPELRAKYDAALKAYWIMGPNVLACHATQAAYERGGPWVDALCAYLEENAAYVRDQLAARAPQIKPAPLEGTYLMWLDVTALGTGDEISRMLADTYRVAIGGGKAYGAKAGEFIRLNIGCPRETLNIAVEALVSLAAHLTKPFPTARITLEDGAEIDLELYPDMAPQAVRSFVHLANAGCFDNHDMERLEPGYVADISFTAFGRAECKYLIANEGKAHGGPCLLPVAPGFVGLGGYPPELVGGDGTRGISGGEFFFPLAESPRMAEKYPMFGRITRGLEHVMAWGKLDLARVVFPTEPPVYTTKPATPVRIRSVRADTHGEAYKAPEKFRPERLPPGW